MSLRFAGLLILTVGSWPVLGAAPDFEREQRLVAEIEDAILDGDPMYLPAGDREVFALFTAAAEEPVRGAVVIMHGRGFHADWHQVTQPLRVGLAEGGWHTLSLQMPVLEKSAKYYDYVPLFPAAIPRIEAGLAFLRDTQPKKLIVHGGHNNGLYKIGSETDRTEWDNNWNQNNNLIKAEKRILEDLKNEDTSH